MRRDSTLKSNWQGAAAHWSKCVTLRHASGRAAPAWQTSRWLSKQQHNGQWRVQHMQLPCLRVFHWASATKVIPWLACSTYEWQWPGLGQVSTQHNSFQHNHMALTWLCKSPLHVRSQICGRTIRSLHWDSARTEHDRSNRACRLRNETCTDNESHESPVT